MSDEDRDLLIKILGGVFVFALYKQTAPRMRKQLRTIQKTIELDKLLNQQRAYVKYIQGEEDVTPEQIEEKLNYDKSFYKIVRDLT